LFAKQEFFAIHYRQFPLKSLWKVWILVKQLFGKKGVFLHPIEQAICFKKPVENLNSCQTIVWQKGLFFHTIVQCTGIEQTIFKKIDLLGANNLSNI
jgi:hypothetical protein